MKKALAVIAALVVIAACAIFLYRYRIIQYSAENIIRSVLPGYVKVDRIIFDASRGSIALKGFRVMNPPGFSGRCLLEIEEVSCKYRMRGESLLDGFEVLEPLFTNFILNMERLKDGTINLNEMKQTLEKKGVSAAKGEASSPAAGGAAVHSAVSKMLRDKKPSDIITLPETFAVKGGKVIFLDRLPYNKPHFITFENIDAALSLKLDDRYTTVLAVSSSGAGNFNGNGDEVVKWAVRLDPTTPKLTMSSRFEVSGVDIVSFEPYYDPYSPLVFKKGRFSGTLIFDFDNGAIGSTNEVHLSDFVFYIKRGYENASFWETNVPALVKYLSTSFDEIVFDFKIKGEMPNPRFYLGPISKQAIASMVIDRISDIIQSPLQSSDATGPKSDLDKAKEVIDLFKGMMKKG